MPRKPKPEHLCTDPTSPDFLAGASIERKLSILKHASPERYDVAAMVIHVLVQREFQGIGPAMRRKAGAR